MDSGRLAVPDATTGVANDVVRFEIDGGFGGMFSDCLERRSGADSIMLGSTRVLLTRSGTFTSRSPVDFLLGGGPRIESPLYTRISCHSTDNYRKRDVSSPRDNVFGVLRGSQ